MGDLTLTWLPLGSTPFLPHFAVCPASAPLGTGLCAWELHQAYLGRRERVWRNTAPLPREIPAVSLLLPCLPQAAGWAAPFPRSQIPSSLQCRLKAVLLYIRRCTFSPSKVFFGVCLSFHTSWFWFTSQ